MDYLKYLGAQATFTSKKWGKLTVESQSFTVAVDGDLVVTVGDKIDWTNPLIRIHCLCVFAEAFSSDFCDCAEQFDLAMQRLLEGGGGMLFYLRVDGRGEGLSAKVAATKLEVGGADTYESRLKVGVSPDSRSYKNIAVYLKSKGIKNIRLLTNNPEKINDLYREGITVEPVPLIVQSENENIRKLYETKATKFGHIISADHFENH